jgi:membrane protein YdbS with pleckstrin-like domain
MRLSSLIRQKPYEHVEHLLRRHPLTFVPAIALFLFLLTSPFIFSFIVQQLFPAILESDIGFPLLVLASAAYELLVILFFYTQFTDYYLDLWVVTNDRIIDIEQFGLFSRTISEVDLFRLQDVTTDVHGVFATFFNYGTVTVTTASENTSIIFRNVPDPNTVRNELIRLSHEDQKFHPAGAE